MATFFVDSNGDDADGLTWATAKNTLASAFAIGAAGDTFYVSNNHFETQASAMTLTSPGTSTNQCFIFCADDGADPPTTLATTATIEATGSSGDIVFEGSAHYYGINFRSGDDVNLSTTWIDIVFTACTFSLLGAGSNMRLGNNSTTLAGATVFNDVTLSTNNTSQYIRAYTPLVWRGGSVTGTALPTNLLITQGKMNKIDMIGVDLSSLGAGKNLVQVGADRHADILLMDCKLGAGITIVNGSFNSLAQQVKLINCSTGTENNSRQANKRSESRLLISSWIWSSDSSSQSRAAKNIDLL